MQKSSKPSENIIFFYKTYLRYLLKISNQLQLQVRDLKSQLKSHETQMTSLQKQITKEQEHSRTQLRLAEEEKERVLRDKEALLEEVGKYIYYILYIGWR